MMLLVSLIVIVVTAVNAGDCPEFCECRQYPRDLNQLEVIYTSINCKSNANINNDLPNNTETLIFSNTSIHFENLINSLCNVQDLPYLSQLILTEIYLPNLSNISVCGLDQLRRLIISNCQVLQLPHFKLTNLQLLELSNNYLKVIDSGQFRMLPVLEVLNLSANAIESINSGSFLGLSTLKYLDLSRNNLTELSDRILIPLITLQYLNLSMNNLKVLNEACFSSLLYLQQLDVSWNKLARVAPGSLQLPSLARLILAGNPQLGGSHEPSLFIGTSRRLQTVDASNTGLKQVPTALTHSIRTLRLAGNAILSINCGDLDSYPLLQLLDLTSNNLSDVEEDALGRLDSLTILYLTDNKLDSFPHSLPDKLRVLHLEYNKIKSIQATDLQGLAQLEVLLLPHNEIKTVKEAAFIPLTSLSSLDLSYNPIVTLPTGSLTGPLQLRVLRMAGLNVVTPAKEVEFPLPTPEHLIILDLSKSPGLAHQMLADTAALAGAKELQELNLATSGLSYIRSDLLYFLPQLRILHLHDNPLNCTNLQWLAQWMRRQDEPEYRTVTCTSPPELQNTLLVDLQNILLDSSDNQKLDEEMNNSTYFQTTVNLISIRGNQESAKAVTEETMLTHISTFPDDNKITINNNPSTEVNNLRHEMTTNYILGYPKSELTNPMSTVSNRKPNKKVNSILKAVDSGSNENNRNRDSNNLHARNIIKVTESSSLQQSTSTNLIIWEGENVTGEMSMYSGESQKNFAHPGMLILAAGFFTTAVIFIIFTLSVTWRNRRIAEDLEINGLPSVTELW